MTALRELAERWKSGDFEERECAEQLIAILDAEGDGGAVGMASEMPGTSAFTMAVFKADAVPEGTELYTQPARSGVVMDAARYRWLRENVQPFRNGNPSPHAIVKVSLGIGSDQRERSFDLIDKAAHVGAVTLDQAIDAARKGEST